MLFNCYAFEQYINLIHNTKKWHGGIPLWYDVASRQHLHFNYFPLYNYQINFTHLLL